MYKRQVATYMQAKNVTLVAKSSGYDVKKEAADGFVKRGEEVTFTITTCLLYTSSYRTGNRP